MDHLSSDEANGDDSSTAGELTAVIGVIVQQCSEKVFQMVRQKITNYLAAASMTSKGSRLRTVLVRPILAGNPSETLKYLLPQTCARIEKIIDDAQTTIYTNYEGDAELTWCLVLFSELLRARGDTLLAYKSMIFSVFRRSVHLIHASSYEAVADAAKDLLKSLTYVYPIEYRVTLQNIEEPFTDSLPIRVSLKVFSSAQNPAWSRPGVNECNRTIYNLNSIYPLPKRSIWPANLSKRSSIPN